MGWDEVGRNGVGWTRCVFIYLFNIKDLSGGGVHVTAPHRTVHAVEDITRSKHFGIYLFNPHFQHTLNKCRVHVPQTKNNA